MGWLEDLDDNLRWLEGNVDTYDGPLHEQLRDVIHDVRRMFEAAVMPFIKVEAAHDLMRLLDELEPKHRDLQARLKSGTTAFVTRDFLPPAEHAKYHQAHPYLMSDVDGTQALLAQWRGKHADLGGISQDIDWNQGILIGCLIGLAVAIGAWVYTAFASTPVSLPGAAISVAGSVGSAGAVGAGAASAGVTIGAITLTEADMALLFLGGLAMTAGAVADRPVQITGGNTPTGPQRPPLPWWVYLLLFGGPIGIAALAALILASQDSRVPDDKTLNRIAADLARKYQDCNRDDVLALIDKYIAQWKKDHPNGKLTREQLEAAIDNILRGLQLQAQIEAMIQQIQASNLPQSVKDRLLADIRSRLSGIPADPMTWTTQNVQNLDGILKGDWATFKAAQPLDGTDRPADLVDRGVTDCMHPGTHYDIDVLKGNRWVEVKNQTILGPGNASFEELVRQLENEMRVARNCPGNLPTNIDSFEEDVPPDTYGGFAKDLLDRLRKDGFDTPITVRRVNFGDYPQPPGGWCK